MSLFNVCNWWSTQCSDLDENYDVASLLCARFGLAEHEKDYVIVGSHARHLSIFYPNPDLVDHGGNNAFKPTDLLLETTLNAPVLGIYAGRFSGNIRNENLNQLAVLHPNSMAIYNIQTVNGVAEHGTQLCLQLLADYKFQRTAFAFCKGHFGKVKGREFFCVIHLDGTLTFYEQDGITYECQFPGHRALPTPVVYCERTDSFIRFAAGWNLECYTYQDLSHSSINKSSYHPVWSICLGEGILDILVVQRKEEYASILILGERNFIRLSDNGKVDFILKLDYAPKCFHSFVIGYYWEPNARLITSIVSEDSKLFVYDDANIIWAAKYQDTAAPVAIQRSNISGLPGAIITLSALGQLRIGYLGSDPFVFKVPPLNIQEISFQQAHKELLLLEEEIKEAVDIRDVEEINRRAIDDVRIQFRINNDIKEDLDTLLLDVAADVAVKELPSCTGILKLKCKVDLNELQIAFNTPEGIRCSQDSLTYINIRAGMMVNLELDFYIAELLHVHTTRIDAIVSFINLKGIPRVIQQSAHLPLAMFYKTKQPQKAAAIKLTLNITSKSITPKLATFFPQFITWESDAQALGLILLCPGNEKSEEIITIVAAKNSNRIRIQSDSLEAFPMILEHLIKVALDHVNSNGEIKVETAKKRKPKGLLNARIKSIMASPFIPSQPILHRIDVHRETQENIRKLTTELDTLWIQFKTLQRKLQEKSEDEPKETLIMQIEENYDHLIAEGDKLMEMRKDERRQRCDLTCSIVVATWIISALHMEEKLVNIISSVLCTPIEDWTELSWEESMSPGVDMLHHYGPLTRAKNSTSNHLPTDTNTSLENFDYIRFRRHFATLFDRIVRIATESPSMESDRRKSDAAATTGQKSADIAGLTQLMETVSSEINSGNIRKDAGNKQRSMKHTTLEAVEDDDEEEYDEEDLRTIGYKKDYGSNNQTKNNNNSNNNEPTECSEWVNENYELPTSEELFSDLGIWW